MSLHQLPAHIISRREAAAVKQMSTFIALFYAKYWLQTPLTTAAPRMDLQLWRDMKHFEV